ncbi:hypothetical protein RQP46_008336 [Phenoliferia psychrophenolica]
MKACLLLVDVQNDFLPGGALAVGEGDLTLPHTLRLLNGKFDVFAASQDFHPPGHISFASRHSLPPFTTIQIPDLDSSIPGATKTQELWPDHCVQGTHGVELEARVHERLTQRGGTVVTKGADIERDAYSAFAIPTGSKTSPMVDLLQAAAIVEVFVVGLATDFCVRASVLAALKANSPPWKVFVVREAVRGVDPKAEERVAVLKELEAAGAKVVSIDGPELAARL